MSHKLTLRLLEKGYGKYKIQIIVLVILGVVSGFMESIGATALIPLFARLTNAGEVSDVISKAIGIFFGWFGLGLGLKALLAFIVGAFILKSLLLILSRFIYTKVSENYARDMRSRLVKETLSTQWRFLMNQKSGYLETILLRDVEMAKSLLLNIGESVVLLASIAVFIIMALNISSIVTLVSLVLGAILFLLIKPLLYRVKELSQNAANAYGNMTHHVAESIAGAKSIKAGALEGPAAVKADYFFALLRNINIKVSLLGVTSSSIVEPVSITFVSVVFAFSYLTGNFSMGAFAATIYLIHKIFRHIQLIQQSLYAVNEKLPYLERVVEFTESIRNFEEKYAKGRPFHFESYLEFKDIHFSYLPHAEILSNVSFKIKKGEMIGLVGKSGAGKTTIVDLLLRLVTPSAGGKILIDSVPIEDVNIKEWRKSIGYIPQEIFIINDTIEQNIRLYDESLTEERITDAAKMAYIYEFIEKTPNKFRAQVGERGLLLSGGEKQRLVLARILAKKPKILVLDEATSALDNESELKIQRAIEGLKGKITIFVIAHRLSTLLNCDKIMFLESGRITEVGPPKELLKNKDSSFYKLYNIRDGGTTLK